MVSFVQTFICIDGTDPQTLCIIIIMLKFGVKILFIKMFKTLID